MSDGTLPSSLDCALQEQVAVGCPGAILAISAPTLGVDLSRAAGMFARGNLRPLRPTDAFRAASVTKVVTAAAAVTLASRGRWSLDDAVAAWLPSPVLESLHHLEGLASIKALTLRRLLGHTSGLPDYFFDPRFQARVEADPDRVWRPDELVEAAAGSGAMLFAPGSGFAYVDTGYVLVGIAIEGLLGRPLAEAYRSLIFDPLGMDDTYLEWHEPSRGPDLSHHYDGDRDLRLVNMSYDWAGGGLVTTATDLVTFLRGLFGRTLVADRWVAEMTHWNKAVRWRPHSTARYLRYGLGLGVNQAYGEDIVGVTGVWGAFAYYWPSGDAAIAGTLNLRGADRPALLDAAICALKQRK